MYKKFLLTILALVPALIRAEQYDFSRFRNKKSTSAIKKALRIPSGFYIEGFGSVSPERILLTLVDSKKEQATPNNEGKKGGARQPNKHEKKHHDKPTQTEAIKANSSLNKPLRTQKVLGGLIGGYQVSRQHMVELTVPILSLSPFSIMPSLSYKQCFPQLKLIDKANFYGKAGLVLPLAFGTADKHSDASPTTAGDSATQKETVATTSRNADTASIATTKTSRSGNKDKKPGKATKTPNKDATKPSLMERATNRIGGMMSRNNPPSAPTSTHTKSTSNQGSSTTHHEMVDQSYAHSKWDAGILLSLGAQYPLHPNVAIDVSGNILYPFRSQAPASAKLPLGLIGWIQLGLHFKLD